MNTTYLKLLDKIKLIEESMIKIDDIFPVGCYYETSNENFDPNISFGGTWVEDSKGLVLIGADCEGEAELEKNGLLSVNVSEVVGEKEHTLTVNEMPKHKHGISMVGYIDGGAENIRYGSLNKGGFFQTEDSGGSQPHNNTQPSLGVRRWHRTA